MSRLPRIFRAQTWRLQAPVEGKVEEQDSHASLDKVIDASPLRIHRYLGAIQAAMKGCGNETWHMTHGVLSRGQAN